MLEKTKQLPVTIGSGFDDYDDDDADENRSSLIKGTKLKFLDGEWVSRDGPISPDTELVVINVIKALQKWVPGRNGPAVTQVLSAGEKFPDLDALNNAAPEEEWRDHFGKQVGPWEGVYAAYLVNMSTMETFTFVAPIGTVGSKLAVLDLKERIRLARAVRNAPVFAIVSLNSVLMPTKWGGRDRPHFEVKRYELLGGSEERREIEHKVNGLELAKPVEPEVLAPVKAKPASGAKTGAKPKAKPALIVDDDEELGEDEADPLFGVAED